MNDEKRDFYFLPSDGSPRKLGTGVTLAVAVRIKDEFLKEKKYKSYYTRMWDADEGRYFDVGSWSEFFLWGTPKEGECQKEE